MSIDRRTICMNCPDRPEGCWRAVDYGCQTKFRAALLTATTSGFCPLGKWDRKDVFLPDVPTIVYTIASNTIRQERVKQLLTEAEFTNWRFFMGGTGQSYWWHIYQDHAAILAKEKAPLLILEDDIEPVGYYPTISPPNDYPIVYLGGGRGGNLQGITN